MVCDGLLVAVFLFLPRVCLTRLLAEVTVGFIPTFHN